MNHIENDIPDSVDQIQPDNHQSGQIAHDSSYATLFAGLKPQDVEQFYQSYQLWSITSRIQAIQAEIEQAQQEKAANAELLEQYHPSPIAQAVLAQLQAHDVNDIALLDQMLERGDDWLDHTMQLLEQCEHLDIIHGNYTEWCMHALEGAYDWIGSMHESETTDEPAEPAATTEVFDESTEQLLLQKLLSDEEEAIQPEATVEVAEEATTSEEAVTPPSPEDGAVETTTEEEIAQIAETSSEDIAGEEEPETPIEPADDNEAEENATNSEISAAIEIPEKENVQADEAEESTQQTSPMGTSDANAVLDAEISTSTNISDEAEESVAEIEPETASRAVETTIQTEEVEIQEEETASQAAVEDAIVEQVKEEQAIPEVLTEPAEDEVASDTPEQEFQVESLSEAAASSEAENTTSNSEEVPVETGAQDTIESASQASASVVDQEVSDTTSTIPEVEEQPEHEAEVEVTYGEVPEEASGDDENNDTDNGPKSTASPANDVDEVTYEPVTMLDHDVQDSSDLALAEGLQTQEKSSSDLSSPSTESDEQLEAEIPYTLHIGESDEDTIAIPKISFSTGRAMPLRATTEAEIQPTMPTIAPEQTPILPVQETLSIVEANTIPGLPAITPLPQAMAPSTTPQPDMYGETNKQPAIQQTPAPIWRESSGYSTHLNSSLPQTSSTLLPEPHQGFFRRLWFKFLAWLRGE